MHGPSKSFHRGASAQRSGGKRPFNKSSRSGGGFNRGGGFNHGGFRGAPKRGGHKAQVFSDVSKFINKAVVVEAPKPYTPTHAFADFAVDPRLKVNISQKGYVTPTPIQDQSIPHVLAGRDVVGIANTGTGKTAAFLIPLIHKVLTGRGERVLVMVPTRELAIQIFDELKGFAKGLGVYGTVCVGGASIYNQLGELRRRPQFVIGTPGRLKDLLERKALNLNEFNTAVLDEADRMLDMGFINDMRRLLALLPDNRQTLFFSATLSKEIEKLIGEFLKNPVHVSVKTRETSASIDQDVVRIAPGQDKIAVLSGLLNQPGFDKVLVFGRTKHGVDRLAKKLVQMGFRAESIHGNKTQGKRQKALSLFKADHVQVLVATDVAARGLDINGVSHVINFDLPATQDDYVHRIGRTGRGGKKGMALTFIG